jgi:hypothetical protein
MVRCWWVVREIEEGDLLWYFGKYENGWKGVANNDEDRFALLRNDGN